MQLFVYRVQLKQHILHRLGPVLRRFPQEFGDNDFHLRGAVRSEFAQWARLLLANAVHQTRRILPGERLLVTQQLVQQYSKGPDVGAFIRMFPVILFRRHVSVGPDEHSGLGLGGVQHASDAEIHHLHHAFLVHHHVARLDIPMNDPPFMRVIECAASL